MARRIEPDAAVVRRIGAIAARLPEVWVALRGSVRDVLDQVTLAGRVSGELPPHVRELGADEDAWVPH